MKFDYIIMNPPYYRSTHLQCMRKAIDYMKDETGELICLHPARWIEDKFAATGNKNKGGKRLGHIVDLTVYAPIFEKLYKSVYFLPAEEMPKYFEVVQFPIDLMISHLTKSKHKALDLYNQCWRNDIEKDLFYKFIKLPNIQEKMIRIDYDSKDLLKDGQYGVYVPGVSGNPGFPCWSTFFTETFSKPIQYTPHQKGGWFRIFASKIEADNFIKYLNTDFCRGLLVMVKTNIKNDDGNLKIIPELPSYNEEYTNTELFNFFAIKEKEIIFLQEILSKYKLE